MSMDCPACQQPTAVVDSRPATRFSKRRRRECQSCQHRFTTYEIVEDEIEQTLVLTLSMKMDNGRLGAKLEAQPMCACGNAARYVVTGEVVPRYCGLCDLEKNHGQGDRR